MSDQDPGFDRNKSNTRNTLLAILVGQVGIVTLVIILAAVLGGLALDKSLGTKPWFTIGLLVASIPVSIILMIFIARKTISKIKTGPNNVRDEEAGFGKDQKA
jgi:F0F1-type ATP synthase assembly protein I